MAHLKIQKVPRNWPIARKGKTYVVRPGFSPLQGVPVTIALRDMLDLTQTRREVKKALHNKHILLNGKAVREDQHTIVLFDVLTIVPSKKNYRLSISSKGKFLFEDVKDATSKVAKIIDKKILKGKKIQLNLSDGRNYLSDMKCKVNDSVVVDLKSNKIGKCLVLGAKANVLIFAGKHAGERGIIKGLVPERKMATVIVNKNEVSVLIKQLMVTE